MREFLKTMLWLSLVLAMSFVVVLSLECCKTYRVGEDVTTKQHNDTTTHIVDTSNDTTIQQHKQDSLMHALIERLMQYENHVSRQDTLRTDSSLVVMDDEGNIVKEWHWRTEHVVDWRRDTLIVYRDKTDSTRIISRYNDSISILRKEIDYYKSRVRDIEAQQKVIKKEPGFWEKARQYWRNAVVALVAIAIITFCIKRYLSKH